MMDSCDIGLEKWLQNKLLFGISPLPTVWLLVFQHCGAFSFTLVFESVCWYRLPSGKNVHDKISISFTSILVTLLNARKCSVIYNLFCLFSLRDRSHICSDSLATNIEGVQLKGENPPCLISIVYSFFSSEQIVIDQQRNNISLRFFLSSFRLIGRSVGIEVNIYRQEPMAYGLLSIVNHDLKN